MCNNVSLGGRSSEGDGEIRGIFGTKLEAEVCNKSGPRDWPDNTHIVVAIIFSSRPKHISRSFLGFSQIVGVR